MLVKTTLGLEGAQRAIAALIAEATKDDKAMAIVVVDDHGDLIASARMDGAPERVLRFAHRKAYTAARMGCDTVELKKRLKERGASLLDYGDPLFTTLQGGVVATVDGEVIGALAVGNGTQTRDAEVAHICLRAALGD